MLLTLTTTAPPATDLGFLLHKHPGRPQAFDVSVGTAHVVAGRLGHPTGARVEAVANDAFVAAMHRGAARFQAFHEAKRLDVSAVPRSLRRLLRPR